MQYKCKFHAFRIIMRIKLSILANQRIGDVLKLQACTLNIIYSIY